MTKRLVFARPPTNRLPPPLLGVTHTPSGVSMVGVGDDVAPAFDEQRQQSPAPSRVMSEAPAYDTLHINTTVVNYHASCLLRDLKVQDAVVLELRWLLAGETLFSPYQGAAQAARLNYLWSVKNVAPEWYEEFYMQLYGVRWIRWDTLTCFGTFGAKHLQKKNGSIVDNPQYEIQRIPTIGEYFAILQEARNTLRSET